MFFLFHLHCIDFHLVFLCVFLSSWYNHCTMSVTSPVLFVFHPGEIYIHISVSLIDLLSCGRMWFLHGWLAEIWSKTGRQAGRETLYVLICDSRGSSTSPQRIVEFLYVFFYILLLCSLSLPMLRSDFRSQFPLPPYFLSVQLILYPTIHPFYFLDIFFPDFSFTFLFPKPP